MTSASVQSRGGWRQSKYIAYLGPMIVFLVVMPLGDLVRSSQEGAPWWRTHPEFWSYPLQTILAGGLAIACWGHYKWRPISVGVPILATIVGVVGILIWIAPSAFFNWQPREGGFDPSLLKEQPALYALTLALRFLRLVIVVPLVEEIFWRGFLMRFLVKPKGEFDDVPFGTFTWPSAVLTTIGVMIIHDPADWAVAAVWGTLMVGLAVRTKSLFACVWAHAVANLLLGAYIMVTQSWELW